jgi:hypothetical protein
MAAMAAMAASASLAAAAAEAVEEDTAEAAALAAAAKAELSPMAAVAAAAAEEDASGRLATRGKRSTSGLWVCTEGLRASSELLVMYVRGTSAKALTMTV